MCPHCGREAPIVYRGPVPCCTACGGVRTPLSGPSVNLAGKPSQVGGVVAKIVGGVVLLVGLSLALGLGLLASAIWTTTVALALSLPIAVIALVTGVLLVQGGRSLARAGKSAERSTHDQALLELAAHRGGVTALDAARALGIPVAEADALLTALAKREPERVAVDIDEQGIVWYRPSRIVGEAFEARVRVAGSEPAAPQEAEDETTGDQAKRAEARR